jgi:hypothetical protein
MSCPTEARHRAANAGSSGGGPDTGPRRMSKRASATPRPSPGRRVLSTYHLAAPKTGDAGRPLRSGGWVVEPIVSGDHPGTSMTRTAVVRVLPESELISYFAGVAVTCASDAEAPTASVVRSITEIASCPTSRAGRGTSPPSPRNIAQPDGSLSSTQRVAGPGGAGSAGAGPRTSDARPWQNAVRSSALHVTVMGAGSGNEPSRGMDTDRVATDPHSAEDR